MRWVNANEVQWQRFSSHRPGTARNRRLLSGVEGQPDNYELSIVEVDGAYCTPRHHHNFDQFRFMLSGRFGVGPDLVLEQGSLSYFPEATHYIQQGIGTSQTLLLQFGGASGAGFMSYRQLEQGHHDLERTGEFAEGQFIETSAGEPSRTDAYQAIWEHVNGAPLSYPAERYAMPVIANPESFAWTACAGEPGVATRSCGRFSERDIGMGFIRVDPSARHALRPHRLYYLLSGAGHVDEIVWSEGTAADVEADEAEFVASRSTTFLYYDRPAFPAPEASAAP